MPKADVNRKLRANALIRFTSRDPNDDVTRTSRGLVAFFSQSTLPAERTRKCHRDPFRSCRANPVHDQSSLATNVAERSSDNTARGLRSSDIWNCADSVHRGGLQIRAKQEAALLFIWELAAFFAQHPYNVTCDQIGNNVYYQLLGFHPMLPFPWGFSANKGSAPGPVVGLALDLRTCPHFTKPWICRRFCGHLLCQLS